MSPSQQSIPPSGSDNLPASISTTARMVSAPAHSFLKICPLTQSREARTTMDPVIRPSRKPALQLSPIRWPTSRSGRQALSQEAHIVILRRPSWAMSAAISREPLEHTPVMGPFRMPSQQSVNHISTMGGLANPRHKPWVRNDHPSLLFRSSSISPFLSRSYCQRSPRALVFVSLCCPRPT